jgi:hypothetical protein
MADVLIPAVSPERADELVEVKQRRQSRLGSEPPLPLSVVIDEAVLHRVVGGPAVMLAQLEHLIAVTKNCDVTVRVIPFSAGAHPAMDSVFTILEFARPVLGVVYVEGLVGWLYIELAQDIERYEQVFGRLCDIALNPKDSIELIANVSANYRRA